MVSYWQRLMLTAAVVAGCRHTPPRPPVIAPCVGLNASDEKPTRDMGLVAARQASARSLLGDDSGAADILDAFVNAHPCVSHGAQADVQTAREVSAGYRRRATLADVKPDDAVGLRAYLRELLQPSVPGAPECGVHDGRVRGVLDQLRTADPELARLLGGPAVRLVVQVGEGASDELAALVRDRIWESLRRIGVRAKTASGADLLTLVASTGPMGNLGNLLSPKEPVPRVEMTSVRVTVTGTWTAPDGELLLSLNFAKSALHLDATAAIYNAAKGAGDAAGTEMVLAYLRSRP